MNNPYSKMLKLMQGEGSKLNPPTIELGIIVSVQPLVIKIGELQLDKDNLLVAEHLLTHKIKFSLNTTSASGNVSYSNGSGNLQNISISNGEFEFKSVLEVEDTVICYAVLDGQKYVVLEKVTQ